MTIRVKSAVLRIPLLVMATLFLAGLGAVVGVLLHVQHADAAGTQCSLVFPSLSVELDGGTTTIATDGAGNLTVTGCSGSFSLSNALAIEFTVNPNDTTTPNTVVLDQTNGLFESAGFCTVFEGTVGTAGATDGTIQVVRQPEESVVLGQSGINLNPAVSTTPPPTLPTPCSSSQTFGTGFSGLSQDQIVDETLTSSESESGITLSAGGGFGTGAEADAPVSVTAGAPGTIFQFPWSVSGSKFIGGGGTGTFTVAGGGANAYQVGTGPGNFYDSGSNNSINFSNAPAGSTLSINVSSKSQLSGAEKGGQAALGTNVSYNFSSAPNTFDPTPFTTITGAGEGNTEFFAGNQTGFNFITQGSGNSADFSAATHAITADLTSYPATVTVSGGANNCPTGSSCDTLTPSATSTPLTQIVGSANGGDTYKGGASNPTGNTCSCSLQYSFTASSATNAATSRFVAGTGADTFNGGGKNIVDFSGLGAATVNDSGVAGGSPAAGTACSPCGISPTTYNFAGLSAPTTFVGSPAGTKFFGGITNDNFVGTGPASVTNELSFQSAPSSSLVLCAAIPTPVSSSVPCSSGAPTPPANVPNSVTPISQFSGQAILGGAIHQGISGISKFDGLGTQSSSSPSTTFSDGNGSSTTPGGNDFVPVAGSNTADFSQVQTNAANTPASGGSESVGVTANLSSSTSYASLFVGGVQVYSPVAPFSVGGSGLTAVDTINGITSVIDSSSGGNIDVAGTTSDSFADLGPNKTDLIDFSQVPSSSNNALTVNVSGVLNGIATNTALVGTTAYFFDQAHANSNPDFISFIGSAVTGEKTVFLASNTSGYSFSGLAPDTVDFSAASPVSVDLTSYTSNNVSVGGGHDSVLSSSGPLGTGPTSITGSSAGNNTFTWGDLGPYTFNGKGGNNRFTAGPSSAGSPAGSAALQGGSGNIVDLGQLGGLATVNDSGVAGGSPPTGKATSGSASYDFSGLSSPTTFVGSPAGTKFFGGITNDNFVGTGPASVTNELSFQSAPSSSLVLCAAIPTPVSSSVPCSSGAPTPPANVPNSVTPISQFSGQAILGGAIHQGISGITTFDGLNGGSTVFADGTSGVAAPGNHTFNAVAGTNSADFSQVSAGVAVNLSSVLLDGLNPGHVSSAGLTKQDSVSGITTITGSSFGSNSFGAGSNVSENFQDPGSGHQDLVDLTNATASATNQLLVNASGHAVSGVGADEAMVLGVGVSYTFTNVIPGTENFTQFIGSSGGNTRFAASNVTGGLTFTASGGTSGNTADFQLSSVGVTANITQNSSGNLTFSGGSPAPDTLAGSFTTATAGNTIVGSATGANTFYGDVTGTSFTANSPANTLSYVHMPSGGVNFNLVADKVSGGVNAPDFFNFPNSGTSPCVFNGTPSGPSTQQPCLQGSPASDVFTAGATPATIQGGGGQDTIDLRQTQQPTVGNSGDTVNLQSGTNAASVQGNGASIGTLTFTYGCGAADQVSVCVTVINGSKFADTYVPNGSALTALPVDFLAINRTVGGANLDLSNITSNVADVCLPISGTSPLGAGAPCTTTGKVEQLNQATPAVFASTPPITFAGVSNLFGTVTGGDYVWSGTGGENLADGNGATLDMSNLPLGNSGTKGAIVTAGSGDSGTVTTPVLANSSYTWSGFQTIVGTAQNDSFTQTAPGTFNFMGLKGTNTLDLSAVSGGASMTFNPPDASCGAGNNSDGSATSPNPGQLDDTWTCMSNVVAPGQTAFNIFPNETASINGGGTGTLNLMGDITGGGAVVDMTTSPPMVTGDGYTFTFTGISTINGTQYNDTFLPGPNQSVTINGGGGQDGLSYTCPPNLAVAPGCVNAPNPVDINLSTSNYLIPSGFVGAGAGVNECSASGGFANSTVNFLKGSSCAISNGIGTQANNDILIAGSGQSNLTGGAGSDRFVLSNFGNVGINAGSGNSTLDLSLLGGFSSFNLGLSSVQPLPTGSVQLTSGTIKTVIASPGGSYLQAGLGSGVTLQGGSGNDILAGGDAAGGNQTLLGGGGSDILIGGIGNDLMVGGTSPSLFVPGEGGDTLQSPVGGNTLLYAGASQGIEANLSSSAYRVPDGKPFGGTVLSALTVTGGFPFSSANITQAGITNLTGSPFNDAVVTGGNDSINGFGGNDLFVVQPGSSQISAGAGTSSYFLIAGGDNSSNNTLHGGGRSTLDFSPDTTAGVTVNLQSGQATRGFGGTQLVSGFSTVIGTAGNGVDGVKNILVANGPGQTLISLNGNDVLEAGPTGDDTLVEIGGGNDTFCSQGPPAGSPCVAGTSSNGGPSQALENRMIGGSGGNDNFFTQNTGYDYVQGGNGFNQASVDSRDTVVNIPASNIQRS